MLERHIMEKVNIDDIQFGFRVPGKGTADAIFTVRQMQEKHRNKEERISTVLFWILKKWLSE